LVRRRRIRGKIDNYSCLNGQAVCSGMPLPERYFWHENPGGGSLLNNGKKRGIVGRGSGKKARELCCGLSQVRKDREEKQEGHQTRGEEIPTYPT